MKLFLAAFVATVLIAGTAVVGVHLVTKDEDDDSWCETEAEVLWPNGPLVEQVMPEDEWSAWMDRSEDYMARCGLP